MSDSFAIREATLQDSDAVAKIHIKTWQFMYKGILPEHFLMNLSLEKRKHLRNVYLQNPNPKIKHYVAILNGKIVGFCDIGPSRDDDVNNDQVAEIYAIFVDPNYLRQRIGEHLLSRGLEHLHQAGFIVVTTWVVSQNQIGRGFYEKQRFGFDGKTRLVKDHNVTYEESRFQQKL